MQEEWQWEDMSLWLLTHEIQEPGSKQATACAWDSSVTLLSAVPLIITVFIIFVIKDMLAPKVVPVQALLPQHLCALS